MIGLDQTSLSYMLVMVAPLVIWFVYPRATFYLWLFVAILVLSAAVHLMKIGFGTEGIYGRPAGACGCDLLCTSENDERKPGFPSGHVATAWMLVVVMSWYTRSPMVAVVGTLWASLVAYSRYWKRCHNLPQIIAGYVAGTIGAIAFILASRYQH